MNSLPLSESNPSSGNGRWSRMSIRAAKTHYWALLGTARFSVHPVAMSVTVRGESELRTRVAALVADQVDLDEPGYCVVPVRPRPHRDGVLEQRPRFDVRTTPDLQFRPVRGEPPVDRSRRHPAQRGGCLVVDVQLAEGPQDRDQLTHAGIFDESTRALDRAARLCLV